MAVPTTFAELSTTAASNPPADTEGVSEGDNQFRQVYAFIRSLYEGSTNGQIAFPATQNASATANTLDDYEEGTFTPTDGSGAGLTLSAATGRYVKVGKVVNIWIKVVYPATANGSNAILGGLPFTSVNSIPQSISVGYSNTTNLNSAMVVNNATTVQLYKDFSGTVATNANLSGAEFYLGGSYEASA